MDIVTIGEVSIDLAPPAPLRWMLLPAPKSWVLSLLMTPITVPTSGRTKRMPLLR